MLRVEARVYVCYYLPLKFPSAKEKLSFARKNSPLDVVCVVSRRLLNTMYYTKWIIWNVLHTKPSLYLLGKCVQVCVSAHCAVYRLFYQQNTEHKIWRCRSMLSSISFDLKNLFTVVSVVRDVCTVCMCNSHLRTLPPLLLLLYVCEAKLIEFISPLHFHLIYSFGLFLVYLCKICVWMPIYLNIVHCCWCCCL